MTGCHDNAATHTEVCSGKVNLLGTTQANILYRHPLRAKAINQGPLDGLACEPNVMPNHHGTGLNYLGVCPTDPTGNVLI
jgi:hypothetical protein